MVHPEHSSVTFHRCCCEEGSVGLSPTKKHLSLEKLEKIDRNPFSTENALPFGFGYWWISCALWPSLVESCHNYENRAQENFEKVPRTRHSGQHWLPNGSHPWMYWPPHLPTHQGRRTSDRRTFGHWSLLILPFCPIEGRELRWLKPPLSDNFARFQSPTFRHLLTFLLVQCDTIFFFGIVITVRLAKNAAPHHGCVHDAVQLTSSSRRAVYRLDSGPP